MFLDVADEGFQHCVGLHKPFSKVLKRQKLRIWKDDYPIHIGAYLHGTGSEDSFVADGEIHEDEMNDFWDDHFQRDIRKTLCIVAVSELCHIFTLYSIL